MTLRSWPYVCLRPRCGHVQALRFPEGTVPPRRQRMRCPGCGRTTPHHYYGRRPLSRRMRDK